MTLLILFAALFVGGHFFLSSLRIRPQLVGLVGERVFQALYAAYALATLVATVLAYNRAPYVELWESSLRWLPLVVLPVAMLLVVCGMSSKNPAALGPGMAVGEEMARGIFRITRHPAMWGFALWALVHIPPNGDVASVIFFGALAFLALVGSMHQDRRKEVALGDGWRAFERHTSHLPFRAIVEKRNHLAWREIGWVRPVIALVIYAALLHAHGGMFGVSPLP